MGGIDDLDRAAVPGGDCSAHRQPEPGPSPAAVPGIVEAHETIEHSLPIRDGDARPVVTHSQHGDSTSLGNVDPHRRGSMQHGVLNEIADQRVQRLRVTHYLRGPDAGRVGAHVTGRGDGLGRGARYLVEVDRDHPLVWSEQMMPIMPVVRVANADEAIDLAIAAEHGFRHTAVMHSKNLDNLSRMAREMDCSIFVKNGPCLAGLGYGGEGFCSFTIASPTGEGITGPVSFSRIRRCTLVDSFRIV